MPAHRTYTKNGLLGETAPPLCFYHKLACDTGPRACRSLRSCASIGGRTQRSRTPRRHRGLRPMCGRFLKRRQALRCSLFCRYNWFARRPLISFDSAWLSYDPFSPLTAFATTFTPTQIAGHPLIRSPYRLADNPSAPNCSATHRKRLLSFPCHRLCAGVQV